LNVHAPTEGNTIDIIIFIFCWGVKDSFYEEPERVIDEFPKYHINILLGDFNAEVGTEDIFKPKIKKDNVHEINSDNNHIRIVRYHLMMRPHFATQEMAFKCL
jgi:hypothetical protein